MVCSTPTRAMCVCISTLSAKIAMMMHSVLKSPALVCIIIYIPYNIPYNIPYVYMCIYLQRDQSWVLWDFPYEWKENGTNKKIKDNDDVKAEMTDVADHVILQLQRMRGVLYYWQGSECPSVDLLAWKYEVHPKIIEAVHVKKTRTRTHMHTHIQHYTASCYNTGHFSCWSLRSQIFF